MTSGVTDLQEWDEAVLHLGQAAHLNKADPGIRAELARAQQAREAAKKKQQAAYSKMFG